MRRLHDALSFYCLDGRNHWFWLWVVGWGWGDGTAVWSVGPAGGPWLEASICWEQLWGPDFLLFLLSIASHTGLLSQHLSDDVPQIQNAPSPQLLIINSQPKLSRRSLLCLSFPTSNLHFPTRLYSYSTHQCILQIVSSPPLVSSLISRLQTP